MYDCTVQILFVGCSDQIKEILQKIPPLPNFRHEFAAFSHPNPVQIGSADVIFAGPDCDANNLAILAASKKKESQLILLREEAVDLPEDVLAAAADLWLEPLDGNLLAFHFKRWRENYKQTRDFEETRHFLGCLMDTSPSLIWFKRKDGIHELVNKAFCDTVNKSREQVQGRGHAYIWNVEREDPACIESERVVMESGRTHVSEEIIETGAGKRQLMTYKAPLRNFDGTMMGTVGIGIDVTSERLYQDRLLRTNAALETLFTSMDCGIILHSLDGSHVFSANKAALKLLGIPSLARLKGSFNMVADTVLEEDKSKLRETIRHLKNEGDSASYEYRILHEDGEILHVMGSAKLVEKDGELICQRFLVDCTAQKLAQEKAEEERKRWQEELVRALCVDFQLVCVFDSQTGAGDVLQLMDTPDRKLREIFGSSLPLAEKFTAYIEQSVHPDDRQACEKLFRLDSLKEKLTKNKIYYFNYKVQIGNAVHYFQLKAVRGESINGAFSIVIGLQSVDARTRYDMEQKNRLSLALEQAKKASEAKSIFLSNMSHDIRTPMNAIAGYTALARKQIAQPENVLNYLGKIGASCDHLINLINDILDMSHIESGKITLDENLCNLRDLLGELWNIVTPTADAKKLELVLEAKVEHNEIYCDKLRLNQILLNILGNSVKYTPPGGKVSLTVREKAGENPRHYEFRIKDNGIGMSQEFLAKIFEPFERAKSSTVAGIQGTGLGMAITHKLVEMMHGAIQVQSRENEGSEFVLDLPFRTGAGGAGGIASENKAEGEAGLPPGLEFCRVLLAEDNPMNQEIAAEFLQDAGYEVEIANNGREAVQMLEAKPAGYYNVILMDVQMPVMDGYTATEKIRRLQDSGLANVPILAMTANSFEEDRQEALARGMNGHVAKPIDFNILFGVLVDLLGR